MISFLTIIEANTGFTIINLLTIVLNIGLIIFMAKDFRIGIIMMLLMNTSLFLLSLSQGWDYSIVLPLVLLSIGLLSMTLWSNNKYSGTGGIA